MQRSAALDAVRVFAMLAIVAGHYWTGPTVNLLVYTWQLPVFFILSGYLWSGRRSFPAEFLLRAKTLLLPTAAWVVLISLLVRALAPLGMQIAAPFRAYWFPPALFVAALLFFFVCKAPLAVQWIIAIAALACVAYVPLGPLALTKEVGLPQGIGSIIFLVAGRTLRTASNRIRHRTLFGLGALAAGTACAAAFPTSFVNVKELYFGLPAVGVLAAVLFGFGLILTAEGLLGRVDGIAARVITRLSLASMVVMFVHVLVAQLLGVLGTGSPIGFVATVLISWCIGLLLLLARGWGWVLTGVRGELTRIRVRGAPIETS